MWRSVSPNTPIGMSTQPKRRSEGMATPATDESREIARPLRVLIPLIRDEVDRGNEAARQAGREHYRRAGEMLLEARAQVEHGQWGPWLTQHFALSARTAAAYMQL